MKRAVTPVILLCLTVSGCVQQTQNVPVANLADLDAAAAECAAEVGIPASALNDPNAVVAPADQEAISDCLVGRGFPRAETMEDAVATLDACLVANGLPPTVDGVAGSLTREQVIAVSECAERGG